MEPNYTYATVDQDPAAANRRRVKLALFALVGALIIFGLYQVYLSVQFRVVSTNPKTSSVAGISPFLNVNFNKQLSNQSVVVSMDPDALGSYTTKGKTLYINLNDPLTVGKKYTITIKSITSTGGAQILNKKISFVPKDIPYDNLPDDQQAAIQHQQPPKNDQNTTPTFTGTPSLINDGLTTAQINDLVQAFNDFAPKAKQVTIDTGSITTGPLNPAATTPVFTLMFDVNVDNTTYKATVSHSDALSLTLQLVNPQTGQQAFNSGVITSTP